MHLRDMKAVTKCASHYSKSSIILKMKEQQHDIKCKENSKKSMSQMGFEPTTLCDLVGYSNR